VPQSARSQLITGGKKNKKEVQGSTEEYTDTCKRANMAAMPDDDPTIEEQAITSSKTSPEEIKEIVLDINFYTSNIMQDNKRMRNDLAPLTCTTAVREQKFEVAKIKTSLKKISKQCADAKCDLEAARKRVNKQQDVIYKLYDLQDKLKQYTRKNSLEIHCVPESTYSTTDQEEVLLK